MELGNRTIMKQKLNSNDQWVRQWSQHLQNLNHEEQKGESERVIKDQRGQKRYFIGIYHTHNELMAQNSSIKHSLSFVSHFSFDPPLADHAPCDFSD